MEAPRTARGAAIIRIMGAWTSRVNLLLSQLNLHPVQIYVLCHFHLTSIFDALIFSTSCSQKMRMVVLSGSAVHDRLRVPRSMCSIIQFSGERREHANPKQQHLYPSRLSTSDFRYLWQALVLATVAGRLYAFGCLPAFVFISIAKLYSS
jgi:urease beta subunit